MAIRIRREELYFSLPVNKRHILAMKGKANYSVPLDDVRISSKDFAANKELQVMLKWLVKGISLKCLVVQVGDEQLAVGDDDAWTNCALYCAECKMREENAIKQFKLSRIEDVKFRLRWKNGKFYPMREK